MEKEQKFPSHIEVVNDKNRSSLIKKSEIFRGQVRGEAIGRLG